MILEEETYKKFGYYPSELTPGADKRIMVACDDCGKIREIRKRSYRALCRFCVMKGERHYDYKGGKIKRVCKECQRIFYIEPCRVKKGGGLFCSRKCYGKWQSKYNKGAQHHSWKGGKIKRKCPVCGRDFEVNVCELKKGWGKYCSRSCTTKATMHNLKPQKTQPEILFENLCKRHNLPFTYRGDLSFWLGKANPDFVHNTRKLVCEVFGDFWHSPLLNRNMRYIHTLEGRTKQLKAEGYKLIVFWETDLKRPDAEAFVLNTLKRKRII